MFRWGTFRTIIHPQRTVTTPFVAPGIESCYIVRPRVLQQRLARCRVHVCPKRTAAWGKIRTVQLTPEYIRDNTVKGFEFSFIDSDT